MLETEGTAEPTNVYRDCRKKAAAYNEKLNSLDITADLLGLSPSTLRKYELNVTKCVPVESVVMMAELYNAPELRNWYCKNECPIGARAPIATELRSLESITIRLLNILDEQKLAKMKKSLLEIAEAGKITDENERELKQITELLTNLEVTISEMRMYAEKHSGRNK